MLAAVPALSADGGAYGAIVPAAYADSPGACPATDASDCTFHVTDSMYMPEVLGRFISEDSSTGRLYVATVPHYSFQAHQSTVRVYDTDRSLIQTVTLPNANITAMGINNVTDELHLVAATDQEHHHSELGPRTHQIATSSLISYDINATGYLMEVASVPLNHTYGTGAGAIAVPKLDVRDIAIDHLHDRVYVAGVWGEAGNNTDDAWKGFAPVMVVETGATHTLPPIEFNATSAWNPFNHSVAATVIVLDVTSTSSIAYVAARQHNEQGLADYGVYALNFSSDAAGSFTREYTALGGYDTYPGESADTAIPDIQSYVQAVDMAKHGDALFVYFVNGSLARIALDGDGIPANSTLIGDEGYGDVGNLFGAGAIAVDGNRGLLYALSNVWHVPELRVLDASDPNVLLISASSIGAETSHSDVAVGADGTVYLSRDWVPHVLVVEPQARSSLQMMIDAAPENTTVVIPDGTYDNTVLTVNKSLTVESENAVFTGNSRLEIIADDVAVSGLTFEGMCLPGYSGGAVSIHNGRTAAGPVPANNGIGNAQRQNVTISGISVSDTCNAGIQLVGKDGLADSVIRDNAFTNIGLKIHRDHDRPADIVAVDEYSAMHGAIALAYHPTGQQPVTGTAITDNAIDGSSAAGIRVTRPDGVTITGNTIRDTADSAIGLAAASKNTVIADNTITNANNETDFDYMDHVDGSGDATHYQRAVPVDWRDPATNKWWAEYAQYDGDPYASEAAIKVWTSGSGGDTTGITVRNNSIAGGNGGFLACAGLCAVETDGAIHSGSRNIRPNTTDVTSAFTISGNTISADVVGAPFANNATGTITVTGGAVLAAGSNTDGIMLDGVTTLGVTGVETDSTATAENPHKVGDTIEVTVTFNKDVNVTGAPILRFAGGGAAPFVSAGADSITFAHTVREGAPGQADLTTAAIRGGSIVLDTDYTIVASRTLPPGVGPIHIDSVSPHMASAPEIAGSNLTLRLDAPPGTVDVSKIAVAGVQLAADADFAVDGSTVTITLPADAVAAAAASERQPSVLMAAGALEDVAGNENSAHSLRVGACGVAESDTCTFHVTDSMYMPEVRAGLIREDYETGRLYVGTVPGYSFQESLSTIRVYGEDRSLLNTTVIAGERIVAMELNHETRELHVVAISNPEGHPSMNHPAGSPYLHFDNPTTGLPPIADARLVSYGMAADGALTLVDSVPLNHAYAKGADHGVVEVPKLDVRDIAVDYVNDLVYVASVWGFADTGNMTNQKANDWKGFSPIMVVDTSGTAHSLREVKFDPDSGWNPFDHAVGASAIDLDAAGNTAYVVARQHDGDGTVSHGVYALDFSDGPGGFTLNYTSKGGIDIWTGPDESAILPYPAMRQAIDMARYGDGLFVTFGNGTMYRFALNEVTGIPEGTPDLIVDVSTPDPGSAPDSGSGTEWWMLWNAGTNALAVDDDRGLLYALNNVWHVPELLVFDASDPGLSLLAASNVGAETFRADLEASARPGGAVYLSRDWVPHIMVVEPQARSGLQGMIDDAPEYSTVTIPDGTYRDTVITVGKPLTIKSDDATFIGNSRLEIISDDVAVDGLSFEGMCLPGYPAGAVSILNGRTAAGAALPFTEGSIGAAERQNVTISGISVSDTCNAGVQLVGKDGLAGSAVSDSTFTGIGLKTARDHAGPADIVSVDEYAAMHGAIGLSFHPTAQAAVTDTEITGNTINGSSAAGIRVMKPDGVNITDNAISDTADSAVGLAGIPKNTMIADNTMVNSNNQQDFDYLDGITGSGLLSHYYQHAGDDDVNMVINATAYGSLPAPDAAIKVWAHNDTANITVRDNRIAGGSGGFVACAGVCGVETDGFIQSGSRDIVNNTADVSSKFTISGNTIYENVAGAPFANGASGIITVTGGAVLAVGNNTGGIALDGVTELGVIRVETNSTATAENPHKIGDTVQIKVIFNKGVSVTGDPVLRFAGGGMASFDSASADTITFVHTVLEGALGQADLTAATIAGGAVVFAMNDTIAASRTLPPAGSAGVDPIHIDSVRPYMASAPEITGSNLTLRLDATASVEDVSKITVAGVQLPAGTVHAEQDGTVTMTLPADAAAAAAASERQPLVGLAAGALEDAAGNENSAHSLRAGACGVTESASCTFHVTDSMHMPEVLGRFISEDRATGRLYAGTVPHYSFQENQSTIRVYGEDRTLLGTTVIAGERIVAMEINDETRELHVVATSNPVGHPSVNRPVNSPYLHFDNPTTGLPPIADARLVSYGMAADGALTLVDSVPLNHAYAKGAGSGEIEVPKLDVRDIAVDRVNDLVYVASVWGFAESGATPAEQKANDWKGFSPVMVVDTSGAEHSLREVRFDPDSGWNPFDHAVGASAIDLDAASNTAYVVARQHDGDGTVSHGVYALDFSDSTGTLTTNYTSKGGVDVWTGPSESTILPNPAMRQAIDMARHGDGLFVTFGNGTMYRFALDETGVPEGIPARIVGAEATNLANQGWSWAWNGGANALAVDESRGLLYALSNVWHAPELLVFDASESSAPLLSASNVGAETRSADLEASSRTGGTVYLSRDWVPHVMVVEPQARTGLQGMIDDAPDYSTVAIPAGTYRDAILTISKPLAVESAGATFTGNSRLEIAADDVMVSGISFEGLCLPGYPAGAVSILNGRTAAGAALPFIESSIGAAERQNVTIRDVSVSNTCNAGIQLFGKDGLADSAVSGNTFTDIGLKLPPGRDAPADIVAVDEYSAMHGAIGLSFHPTGQAAVVDTLITNNTIQGSSAAGIRVMHPYGVNITDNAISDTADSAVGLAGIPKNTMIADNAIVNSNNQQDFDYLDGITGSGNASHYYQGAGHDHVNMLLNATAYDGLPAPDAAVKVWASNYTANITIRDNRIADGSGGIVVCAGVCGVETDGHIHSGSRDIVSASNDVTAAFTIRDNTMYESVGGVHVNYLANGSLSAAGNTLPPSANLSGTGPVNASTAKAGVIGIVLADEEPPASGYGIGEMVGINITFNVPVDVVPSSADPLGLPYLEFSNGETATYASSNGTNIMFTHTVALGMIPDYATAMLVLNGSRIVNSADPDQQAGTQLPPAGAPELAKLQDVVFNTSVLSVRADPAISAAAGTLSLYFDGTINAAAMDLAAMSVNGMNISGAVPPPRDTASPVIKLPASVIDSLPQGAASAQVTIRMAAVADRDTRATLLEDYDGTARIIQEYAVHASCDEPEDDCLYAIGGTVPLPHNAPAAALARANPNDGLVYAAGGGLLAVYDTSNAANSSPVGLAAYDNPTIHDIQINEATNTAYVAITHGPAGSRAAALLQVDPVAPHAVTDSTPVNYTASTANATTITSVTPSRLAIDPHGDRAYVAVAAPSGGPVLSYDIASGAPNAPTRAAEAYPAQARDATALAASANATDGIMYAAAADGLHVLAFSEATANYTVRQTLPAAGAALDMEAAPGSLYVLHANGTLASYSVEHDGSAVATALELRSIMDGQLPGWDSGARPAPQIELDAANSRLYAASHASVSVYNATGAGEEGRLSVVSLREGSQPLDLAISPDGSTALVVPSDAAHLLQIRPMPKSAIHTAIDAAPPGGTVLLPAGTYDDIGAVILDRPMALNGSGAVTLRGDSHVRAYAAGGALSINGVAFSGTACSQGNPEGSAVAIFSAGAASISGSTFENTCGDAVAVSAPAGLDSLAATGNTFTDIGIPADGSAPERRAAAVSVGGSHDSEGQLAAGTISSNYVFGTSYAGVQLAGASAVDVSGNYVEDTPGPAVLVYQTASDVTIRGNTIVRADSEPDMDYLAGVSGSGSASFYESGPPPEAAIAVWAGADGIRATLNRVYESGPGGAFLVCEGACHAETDGTAASTAGGPHTVTTAISFNHNVLHGANSNIANLAGGMLSARNNFFPGHADQAATYVNDREKVDYVPAFDGPGPVKIGLLTLPLDAPHTRDSEIAAATAYSVDAYNSRQVAVGGLVSLELVQRAIPLGTPLQQNATFMLIHEGIDDAAHEPILRHAIDSSTEYHEDNGLRASLDRINDMDSDVPHYPFAFGLDAIVRANGANASLSGTYDIRQLTGGQAGFDAIVADLNRDGEAWWQYTFTNPLTGGEQLKRSLLVLHDGIIYGAGYYAGDGPSYYVGPTSSSTAAAILPYADANDLVLVSPVSTATSLAVRNDSLFRLVPTDAHAGDVISEVLYAAVGAGTVQGNTAGVLIPVAVDDPYGRSLVDHVKSTVTGLQGTPDILDTITYEQGQDWGGVLDDLAARIAQVNPTIADDRVAVFHVGFAADHVAIMEAANGHARRADLASAVWYADSLGNHPGVISSSGARAFAEDADLTATSFHVPPNPINAMVDAAVRGALGDADLEPAANSYSAHDAVSMLGRAVTVHADMPPAVAAGLRGIASVAPGALGSSVLDRNGDLILPTTFAVWTVDGGAWERVGDLKYGPTFCGMSLEKPGLDLGNISPGRASGTDVQTVSNSGTKTLDRGIFLSATPWTLEAESPSDNRQLPYSLTEIDPDPRGEFTALSNSPRTVIFEGMEPAKSYDVRFRINLSTVDTLPSGMLMQTVTYGIACD